MLSFENEEYEVLSDTETDLLLADLPFELVKENLRAQIADPLSTKVNYIDTVVDKFRILREEYGDNEDAVTNIHKMMVDFYSFLIQEIDQKFNMSIHVDYNDLENVMRIGSALYNFMILRYKKNITRFIYRFINKNKKLLVDEFGSDTKRKDVTTIAVKKQVKNKDDALILSNLPSIIKYVMNLDIDPIDFLRYAGNDEYYEASVMRIMILEGSIIGDFVEPYLDLIKDEHEQILDEVQTDVKQKLLKKM